MPKRGVISFTNKDVKRAQNTGTTKNLMDAKMNGSEHRDSKSKVEMKKRLGLLEGVSIILGIIIGSGIFVSPKGVINEVEAVGSSLLVWIFCGVLSMIGALCYAELGTSIPKSGGDYTYIFEAFGSLPAFLYLWDAMMIFVPTTNAIMSLIFAAYILQPFFNEGCEIPTLAKQLLAAATICILTYLNSFCMKLTTKMQNVIMFTKIAALIIIIGLGLSWVILGGHTENFEQPFANTQSDPGKLAVAFYSGIFSFAGWNYLNLMTEELRDPYRNLPRAIYISLPLVTIIYVLANMAYLAVLSSSEMKASDAVAETFGGKLLGSWSLIIPILVAIASFGGLSVHIMTSSRMCFVGARNGHMPTILSQININSFTPLPSLVFLCILSIIMLICSDVFVLITYCSIVESFFIMLSISALLYFRYTQPDMERPIKVPIWIPIVFVVICAFLVIMPVYVAPYEVGMGLLITVIGIPFYYAGIGWKSKPQWLLQFIRMLTVTCQKLFLSVKEEKDN